MERLTNREFNRSWCNAECGETDQYNCDECEHFHKMRDKLARYEDLEEQGLLLKLPKSDWKYLIEQLATIIEKDFIVYSDGREFIANQFFLLEYDEDFRFSATCRCFYGTENDWWCDEDCVHGEDGKGCYITFDFSDLGKTVFLTKAEAEEALKKMEGEHESISGL